MIALMRESHYIHYVNIFEQMYIAQSEVVIDKYIPRVLIIKVIINNSKRLLFKTGIAMME